jgi:hypothetical protein
MRIKNLVVSATLLPVLLFAGCGNNESSDLAAQSPGAQKAAKHGLTDTAAEGSAQVEGSPGSDDPVVNAYYSYRVALDVMMRSGGKSTKQLVPVMTNDLYRSISQQAKYYRSKRLHNTGVTTVVWAKRTLLADGVIVRACYDTKKATTVDSKGKSALPPKTPTRWLDEMRVEQVQGRWVVDGGRTTPVKC